MIFEARETFSFAVFEILLSLTCLFVLEITESVSKTEDSIAEGKGKKKNKQEGEQKGEITVLINGTKTVINR